MKYVPIVVSFKKDLSEKDFIEATEKAMDEAIKRMWQRLINEVPITQTEIKADMN